MKDVVRSLAMVVLAAMGAAAMGCAPRPVPTNVPLVPAQAKAGRKDIGLSVVVAMDEDGRTQSWAEIGPRPVSAAPVVTNYAGVSTHTLKVAADKEADVIWLQQYKDHDFILMRCHNAAEGPSCVRARTP
jgi:hypothetical protein